MRQPEDTLVGSAWVKRVVPETRGKSLEDLKHYFNQLAAK